MAKRASTTRRTTTRKRQPASRISKPGERVIRETDRALPVKPVRAPKANETIAGPALDRRKQFSGTDEPARKK